MFHGPPPRAGTKLTVTPRIEDIYEKQGGRGGQLEFLVVRTDYTDESGGEVATVRSTAIYTSKAATA